MNRIAFHSYPLHLVFILTACFFASTDCNAIQTGNANALADDAFIQHLSAIYQRSPIACDMAHYHTLANKEDVVIPTHCYAENKNNLKSVAIYSDYKNDPNRGLVEEAVDADPNKVAPFVLAMIMNEKAYDKKGHHIGEDYSTYFTATVLGHSCYVLSNAHTTKASVDQNGEMIFQRKIEASLPARNGIKGVILNSKAIVFGDDKDPNYGNGITLCASENEKYPCDYSISKIEDNTSPASSYLRAISNQNNTNEYVPLGQALTYLAGGKSPRFINSKSVIDKIANDSKQNKMPLKSYGYSLANSRVKDALFEACKAQDPNYLANKYKNVSTCYEKQINIKMSEEIELRKKGLIGQHTVGVTRKCEMEEIDKSLQTEFMANNCNIDSGDSGGILYYADSDRKNNESGISGLPFAERVSRQYLNSTGDAIDKNPADKRFYDKTGLHRSLSSKPNFVDYLGTRETKNSSEDVSSFVPLYKIFPHSEDPKKVAWGDSFLWLMDHYDVFMFANRQDVLECMDKYSTKCKNIKNVDGQSYDQLKDLVDETFTHLGVVADSRTPKQIRNLVCNNMCGDSPKALVDLFECK